MATETDHQNSGIRTSHKIKIEAELGEDLSRDSQLSDYFLSRDRARRQIRPPSRFAQADFIAFALNIADSLELKEPVTYAEAKANKDWISWRKAMDEEIKSLKTNEAWILVSRPKGKKVIGCKWVYKLKPEIPEVEKARFKARLVAKGYSQVEGIDYHDVYSPVVKDTSIRLILAIAAIQDLELEQLDVKTAFLHGSLNEEIYMSQPKGYLLQGDEDKVCFLKKSLYCLKQSPTMWYKRFDIFMLSQGFGRSKQDSCFYFSKLEDKTFIYLLIYVNDMLIACKNKSEILKLKQKLNSEFEMNELGLARSILGMNISRDRKSGLLTISQSGYVGKIVDLFGTDKEKSVSTPIGAHFKLTSVKESDYEEEYEYMKGVPYSNAVRSIMYAMICTRPDVAYGIGLVSRFMSKPRRVHWHAVKWLLKYFKGTAKLKLMYKVDGNKSCKVSGYRDSDFGGDLYKRKSISGYVFTIGGNTIS